MRTLTEVRALIQAKFIENTTIQSLYDLDPSKTFQEQFSKVSVEAVMIDVYSICSWILESIFDQHMKDVQSFIREEKAHTLKWYRNKALNFRLGQSLVLDTDQYSDIGLTEAEIAASKIIAYAAAIESEDGSGIPVLRIKTSKSSFSPLDESELNAIREYFAEIKDAGVKLLCTSGAGDGLKANLTIYYNPQIINGSGISIVSGNEPVREAVKLHLKSLPYNGEYTPMAMIDAIQKVNGVEIAQANLTEAKYGDLPFSATGARYIPDAGWMRIIAEEDLTITYIPYTPNA